MNGDAWLAIPASSSTTATAICTHCYTEDAIVGLTAFFSPPSFLYNQNFISP